MATAGPRSLGRIWLDWVKTLYTGYLACVMATGIVSIALFLNGVTALSVALWVIACLLLVFMTGVYILRWLLYPHEVSRNLNDPTTVFGYFTFVAGVGVVATRFSLSGWTVIPGILTLVAAAAWLALTYWAFAMLIFVSDRPIQEAVNGSWLIAIVGTESLAITWVLLTSVRPQLTGVLQLVSYMFWTFGVLLYLIFIAFIMYRFFFTHVRPTDLSPPYWINMGAMAITTVAGARLYLLAHPDAFLGPLKPYILGFTVMMWAWGTWWIPLLIIIGIWKYGIEGQALKYAPPLWSIVFPLGMYATAVQLLAKIPGLAFLSWIGPAATWVAFGAWVLTGAGWVWSALSSARHTNDQRAALPTPAPSRENLTPSSGTGADTFGRSAMPARDGAAHSGNGIDIGSPGPQKQSETADTRDDVQNPVS